MSFLFHLQSELGNGVFPQGDLKGYLCIILMKPLGTTLLSSL